MHFEFLLEEESAEKVLDNILPQIVTGEHSYRCIRYQGKQDMLKNLPIELKAYAKYITSDYRIVVLIDKDRDDCHVLKNRLDNMAIEAGLITKTNAQHNNFQVVNRISIEEIEAWFFGDADAMRKAYPRLSKNFERKEKYRNPDAITNTSEVLEAFLQRNGYFKTGIRKIEVANDISKYMLPLNNTSKSFQVFWQGITDCLQS